MTEIASAVAAWAGPLLASITRPSTGSGGGSAEPPLPRHRVGGVQRSAAAPSAAMSNLRRAS
eukprot:scaffold1135_cov53-Phaeocystis_antarctica.AAC.2